MDYCISIIVEICTVVYFKFSAVLKVENKRFITSINLPYDDDSGQSTVGISEGDHYCEHSFIVSTTTILLYPGKFNNILNMWSCGLLCLCILLVTFRQTRQSHSGLEKDTDIHLKPIIETRLDVSRN